MVLFSFWTLYSGSGEAANYKIAHQDRKYIKLTSLRIGNRIHAIADQMLQSTRHIKHYITCSKETKERSITT